MTTERAEFDVVVVGSGAAGMTAALAAAQHGLRGGGAGEDRHFGGSTARSGGGIWAPGNEVLRRAGVADTPEQARAYLAHVAGDEVPAARQQALLAHGPAMLVLRAASTPRSTSPGCRATPTTTPRRRAGWPPGAASSRCRSTARVLGARAGPPQPGLPPGADGRGHHPGRLPVAEPRPPPSRGRCWPARRSEAGWPAAACCGQRTAQHGPGPRRRAAGGPGRPAQVPVWLNTPLTGLDVTGGRVTGVGCIRDGQPAVIAAAAASCWPRAASSATSEMRRRYQRPPIGTEWTTGAAGNTGDAILAGAGRRGRARPDGRRLVGPVHPAARAARTSAWPSAACPAACWSTARASASSTRPPRTSTPCTPCTTATRPAPRTSRPG